MPKTIVFFTFENGIAHVTRSLAVAEALADRDHTVIFAVTKKKSSFVQHPKIIVETVSESLVEGDISSLKSWSKVEHHEKLLQEELHIIDKHKPDLAVVDLKLSALVATALKNIPVAYLTSAGGLPSGSRLSNPGWPKILHQAGEPVIQKFIWFGKKSLLKAINALGKRYDRTFSIFEYFKKVSYLIPEYPFYSQPVDRTAKIGYCGPLFWDGFNTRAPSWLKNIHPDGKTIYVSFGGTGFSASKLVSISKALLNKGFRVIVSSSIIADKKEFPSHKNLFVEKYLPGDEVARRVDAVVCHGGYGTMMQAVLQNKPVVAIPFNPDQVLHSLRFQELGWGKMLYKFDLYLLWGILSFDWKAFEHSAQKIRDEEVVQAVEEMIRSSSQVKRNITSQLGDLPRTYTGGETAASWIEHLL